MPARAVRVAAMLFVVAAVSSVATASGAQQITQLPGFNERVSALTAPAADGSVYVGGSFTSYKPWMTGGNAVLDAASAAVDTSFPRVGNGVNSGTVYAVQPDGSGGYYVGGAFTCVGGDAGSDGDCTDQGEFARNNLVHLSADGSIDPAWAPSVNVSVRALAVSGSQIFLGGGFNQAWGPSGTGLCTAAVKCVRRGLASVDTTTGEPTAWNPDAGIGKIVYALAVSGSKVIAGGNFVSIDAVAHNSLASIDMTTGLPDVAWDTRTNSTVYAFAMVGGTLYIAGGFSTISQNSGSTQGGCLAGQSCPRGYMAALDPATGYPTSWDPQIGSTVRAVASGNGVLYAGGSFNVAGTNALSRSRLAALDPATGAATSWDPSASGDVQALSVTGGTVYIGGAFTRVGGQSRVRLAAVDGTSGALSSWNPGPVDGSVSTINTTGGRVFVGGSFATVGGTARSCAAQLDANGDLTAWTPDVQAASGTCTVQALAAQGGAVYMGGDFATVNGTTRNRLAAVNAAGTLLPWDPNASGVVSAMVIEGNAMYVGGSWTTTIGGQTRPALAKLDLVNGTADATWDAAVNTGQVVNAVAVAGGTVYLGGTFSAVHGTARNRIAAVDTSTGALVAGWNPNITGSGVTAMVASNGTVYAGGAFTSVGGTGRVNLAAIDGTTGTATNWNAALDGFVYDLAPKGTTLYAAGQFSTAGGSSRSRVAALDTTVDSNMALPWNPGPTGGSPLAVYAVGVGDTTAAIGGYFTNIGTQSPQAARRNIAVVSLDTGDVVPWWIPPPPPPPTPDPTPEPTPTPDPASPSNPADSSSVVPAAPPSGRVVIGPSQTTGGIAVDADDALVVVLACPSGGPGCSMSGALSTSRVALRGAMSQQAGRVVVLSRLPATTVASGRRRAVVMHLSPTLMRALQAKGVRRLPAAMTIRTASTAGTAVRTQRVVLRIPAAATPVVTG